MEMCFSGLTGFTRPAGGHDGGSEWGAGVPKP